MACEKPATIGRGRVRHRGVATGGLLVWLGVLACAVTGLHGLGGPLAPPPLTDPGGVGDWLSARQPGQAAIGLLRLVALAMAWYLLVATVAGVLAQLLRVPALLRAADLLTIPAVRRIVNASVGATVAAATMTGAMTTLGARPMEQLVATSSEVVTPLPDPPAPTPPTLRRLPDEPGRTPPTTVAPPVGSTSAEAPPRPDAPIPHWDVRPGQHFWAIAEEVLAAAWQRPPTDAEVDKYWRVLVDFNREILRDRANPDLLYPGQTLTVPPPPPPQPQPPSTEPVPESGALAPDS